jgi:hypothetical protein
MFILKERKRSKEKSHLFELNRKKMLEIITNVCFGDSREFWPASVSKFREKKTDLLLDTNTRHGSKNNNFLCVFWREKNDYTVKLGPELRWTGTPFYYYYYFLFSILMTFTRKPFCFNWPIPYGMKPQLCTIGRKKEKSEHFTWFVEKLFELLTRILFWKTLKRDGCKERSRKERTVNTPEEKLPRISPLCWRWKRGATFYTLSYYC